MLEAINEVETELDNNLESLGNTIISSFLEATIGDLDNPNYVKQKLISLAAGSKLAQKLVGSVAKNMKLSKAAVAEVATDILSAYSAVMDLGDDWRRIILSGMLSKTVYLYAVNDPSWRDAAYPPGALVSYEDLNMPQIRDVYDLQSVFAYEYLSRGLALVDPNWMSVLEDALDSTLDQATSPPYTYPINYASTAVVFGQQIGVAANNLVFSDSLKAARDMLMAIVDKAEKKNAALNEWAIMMAKNQRKAMPWISLLLPENNCTDEICDDGIDNDCDGDVDCGDSDCSEDPACQAVFTNSLGMTFNLIPAGTFTMGSPESELGRDSDETQHEVTLTQSFYMQTTEVTQGQWEAVMGENPSYFSSCGNDCPVEEVSWNDIQDFLAELNAMGEGTYRLPTEAEWEYATRAGSQTAFANGDITEDYCGYDSNLDAMGWYCYNSSSETHPVAQKQANGWGLYDMHGNVWEWCQDWYGDYPSGSVTDPTGPSGGTIRVHRGGSWYHSARLCRSADRNGSYPDDRRGGLGFRLLRTN